MQLYRYSDYVLNEGSRTNPTVVYWNDQLEKLLKDEWRDISIEKEKMKLYKLKFRSAGESDYNFYQVLLNTETGEEYLMENPKLFLEKFNTEFWKDAPKYVEQLAYTPKFLGDVQHVKDAKKYNL